MSRIKTIHSDRVRESCGQKTIDIDVLKETGAVCTLLTPDNYPQYNQGRAF